MRLLNYLLNHFLFGTMMFFAAGAGVLDVGTGGGDANAGADGGSSGENLSGETGADGSGSSAGSTDNLEEVSTSDASDASSDPNASQIKGVPQKFSELYKTDKDFRNLWESAKSLRTTFPGGVKEAVQLAKTIQEYGGIEGIGEIKTELDQYHADAELLTSNPEKWIETEFEASPEAALKTFAHSLDYVSEKHPEHYDHLMAKVIFNDLKENSPAATIWQFLSGMKDASGAAVPEAVKLAKDLADYYNGRREISTKVPTKRTDSVQDAREKDLTQKEQQIRNKTINTEAAPYMTRSIESVLSAAAKSSGFDIAKLQKEQPNRYARFIKDARATVHAEVLGDNKFIDRYSAALASGDTAKCVRMLNTRHDQAIKGDGQKPGVVAPVFHEWFGAPKAVKRTTEGGNNTPVRNGGGKETPMLMNSLPPAKDINYSAPETDKWNGIYRLKTGKLIQVKRA